MNYLVQQCTEWFQAHDKKRQAYLVGGSLVITIITSALLYWVITPGYGVLFNHLDNRDANQILAQLEQSNIPYQLRNQGSEILIDKQLIDKTRIKLMGSDLGLTHSVGFELFDKTDFGMTDFSQKINYQRALQGELERTIASLEEVKQARIHLVIPESHLFQQESNLPRVAVTLHLAHPLTATQVKSIQQLLTASVANLPATNVVIVDQNGNSLTNLDEDSSTNHFTAKKSIERYLNEKVTQMLSRIFTDEDVMVKIDATLNYDELQRELVKPRSDGLITHEKQTKHAIISTNKADKKPTNQDFTSEKSYEFGREKEQFTRANGTIERLTISVVVPHATDPEKIGQVERLVKSIVGFNAKRGDTISVEALLVTSKPSATTPLVQPLKHKASNSFWLFGIPLVVLLSVSLYWYRHKRLLVRQQLLTELNHWLIEHG